MFSHGLPNRSFTTHLKEKLSGGSTSEDCLWIYTDIVMHSNLFLLLTGKDIPKVSMEVITSIPNTWEVDGGRSGVQITLGCV